MQELKTVERGEWGWGTLEDTPAVCTVSTCRRSARAELTHCWSKSIWLTLPHHCSVRGSEFHLWYVQGRTFFLKVAYQIHEWSSTTRKERGWSDCGGVPSPFVLFLLLFLLKDIRQSTLLLQTGGLRAWESAHAVLSSSKSAVVQEKKMVRCNRQEQRSLPQQKGLFFTTVRSFKCHTLININVSKSRRRWLAFIMQNVFTGILIVMQ